MGSLTQAFSEGMVSQTIFCDFGKAFDQTSTLVYFIKYILIVFLPSY